MKRDTAFRLVREELDRAQSAHPPMNSPHEGWAVLQEEIDELWIEVKKGNGTNDRGVSEAVQSAAMAVRYLLDLCDEPAAEAHEEKVRRHATPAVQRVERKWQGSVPDSLYSQGIGGYSG